MKRLGIETKLSNEHVVIGNRPIQVVTCPDRIDQDDQDAALSSTAALRIDPFGFVLWEATLALAHWMARQPKQDFAGRSMLELGCGIGVFSAWYAQQFQAPVIATDGNPDLADLVLQNAQTLEATDLLTFHHLPWGERWLGTRPQVLVACDILYAVDHAEPLLRTLLSMGGATLYVISPPRYAFNSCLEHLQSALPQLHQENFADNSQQVYSLAVFSVPD